MALREAFGPIERINPYYHLVLVELVRELKEVPVRLRRYLLIDLLELSEVVSVGPSIEPVVFKKHLLRNVLSVYLVGHNVGFLL
jgi:hypothetical protein